MRIAHLADLHLGKVFHGTSLIEDQRAVLWSALSVLRDREVDVLVLAGDLYDRALPGRDAVRLFDAWLREVHEGVGVPVIAIAGNHDSADHLGFGAWLFSRGDVHVRGRVEAESLPITLEDAHGDVTFYPLPYVEPESARELLGVSSDEPDGDGADGILRHRDIVRAMLAAARRHAAAHGVGRKVAVAHAFVQGARWPDETRSSERSLYLGGVGAVPADAFAGFDYVALGHLHRPQSLVPDGSIRYAGSMMKYSFDEVGHDKGMTVVELDAKGLVSVEHVPLKPPRDLARVKGSLDALLVDPTLTAAEGCFVSVTLDDRPPPLMAMERLRKRFPHVAELRFEAVESTPAALTQGPAPRRDPVAVFEEFFARCAPGEATDEEREIFRAALAGAPEPAP